MMKKMDKKAFTLIELIVVIAVVGILVLLAAPRFTGYTQKAELIRIQHDTKAMEEEIGTMLINGDDDFNKWENNMKDLNQLAQEGKLFEKEGFVTEGVDESHLVANRTVDLRKHASQLEPSNKTKLNAGGELYSLSEDLSISETYKVIPERYKDEINSKLKGTFYANSDGKVYYEHVKSLSRILTEPEEEPVLEGPIPIATAEELNNVRNATIETYGVGTQWEGLYEGGLDKEYIQVADVDLSEYSEEGWNPIGQPNESWTPYVPREISTSFKGTYDGGDYTITGLEVKGDGKDYQGLFGLTQEATIRNVDLIDNIVTGKERVGGLVGHAFDSTIENSYATGSVTGTGIDYAGGLVGAASNSNINNSYTTGPVVGRRQAGGLVGWAGGGTISDSHAEGSVTGESEVGGLTGGASNSAIENSYATGKVIGTGTGIGVSYTGSATGGLVGSAWFRTTINNSYATGDVIGGSYSVGGLVGEVNKGPKISNSYATGSVESTGNNVGGLVGSLASDSGSSTISNSYATGSAKGVNRIGGLVGRASNSSSTIENSYATGEVTGSKDVGGLVGDVTYSKISNSYWDTETTGRSWSAGGTGKTTDEMKNQVTYSGWDFTNIWEITPGNYPTLR